MPKNGQAKSSASEVVGPRSLTRLLGLFDVLAKSKDGMTPVSYTHLTLPTSDLV